MFADVRQRTGLGQGTVFGGALEHWKNYQYLETPWGVKVREAEVLLTA